MAIPECWVGRPGGPCKLAEKISQDPKFARKVFLAYEISIDELGVREESYMLFWTQMICGRTAETARGCIGNRSYLEKQVK